jgi:hypothetical protein
MATGTTSTSLSTSASTLHQRAEIVYVDDDDDELAKFVLDKIAATFIDAETKALQGGLSLE